MGKNKKKNKNLSNGATNSVTKTKPNVNGQVKELITSSQKEKIENNPYRKQDIDIDACLFAYKLAKDHNQPHYCAKAQSYIIANFDYAVHEERFYTLSKEDIVIFLQAENLLVSCEEIVYETVIGWVKHEPNERLKHLNELLELVRFPQLPLNFLDRRVLQEKLIVNSEVGRTLVNEAIDCYKNRMSQEQFS